MESIWAEKTLYYGEHEVMTRTIQNQLLNIDTYHIFYNQFSFLHLEQDFVHQGGAHNTQTLYLFKRYEEETDGGNNFFWQLKGVVSGFGSGDKPGYVANLGDSFWEISATQLQTQGSEYELKFF